MIVIEVPDNSQIECLENYIKQYGLKKSPLKMSMVVMDGKILCGYGNFVIKGEEAVLEQLHIAPEFRGLKLGDALLRALFNFIEKKGCSHIYIPSTKETTAFLEKEDLKSIPNGPDWYLIEMDHIHWYLAQVPAFFQKPCKGR